MRDLERHECETAAQNSKFFTTEFADTEPAIHQQPPKPQTLGQRFYAWLTRDVWGPDHEEITLY